MGDPTSLHSPTAGLVLGQDGSLLGMGGEGDPKPGVFGVFSFQQMCVGLNLCAGCDVQGALGSKTEELGGVQPSVRPPSRCGAALGRGWQWVGVQGAPQALDERQRNRGMLMTTKENAPWGLLLAVFEPFDFGAG